MTLIRTVVETAISSEVQKLLNRTGAVPTCFGGG